MNGRVYDYNLGRFLSVDPFIQSPTNTQSMNPYSYIMNNPLAGTDPSGYMACGGIDSKKRCEPMTFDKVMAGTSRSTMAGGKLDHGNVTRFISVDNGNNKHSATSQVDTLESQKLNAKNDSIHNQHISKQINLGAYQQLSFNSSSDPLTASKGYKGGAASYLGDGFIYELYKSGQLSAKRARIKGVRFVEILSF